MLYLSVKKMFFATQLTHSTKLQTHKHLKRNGSIKNQSETKSNQCPNESAFATLNSNWNSTSNKANKNKPKK